MRKVIIIIICLILGFLLYTFVVALYKANFNVDGALPNKNTSKEKPTIEETKVNTDKLKIDNSVVVETTSTNSEKQKTSEIERKKVEIYLAQNINKLVPKSSYRDAVWGLQNFTVDTNANIGIVVYSDGHIEHTKDFLYYQDAFGDITNMILR